MYTPRHFANDDLGELHALMDSHPLATLVTGVSTRLDATHLPCLLDRDAGPRGRLRFHLARDNPASRALGPDREVLVVFTGPQCYISPDWYRSRELVPTWNYAAVHAYGRPRILDEDGLQRLLEDLSERHEAPLPKRPWSTGKLPGELYATMRQAIVGYEMPIGELQGKWKMGQNRRAKDRVAVIEALESLGGDARRAVAAQMRLCLGARS